MQQEADHEAHLQFVGHDWFAHADRKCPVDPTSNEEGEETLKALLTFFGIVSTLSLCPQSLLLVKADCQTSKPVPEWTESEARKILSDSPWAKRSKVRSATKTVTPAQTPENTTRSTITAGPGGGTKTPLPTPAEVFNQQSTSPRAIPCLGWGVGFLAVPSPTSEECKAAWQSANLVMNSGLPPGSVIVLWESAVPVREARNRLAIAGPSSTQTNDLIIIQMIAHPMLRQVNTSADPMRKMIKDSAVLLRNGKNRIEASDVSFIETNEAVVRFFFPRQQTIQPGDKEIIFRFEMLDTLAEAKFSLKDMVYRGQPAQ